MRVCLFVEHTVSIINTVRCTCKRERDDSAGVSLYKEPEGWKEDEERTALIVFFEINIINAIQQGVLDEDGGTPWVGGQGEGRRGRFLATSLIVDSSGGGGDLIHFHLG